MHTLAQDPKGVITLSRAAFFFSKGKAGTRLVPPLDTEGELVLTDLKTKKSDKHAAEKALHTHKCHINILCSM